MADVKLTISIESEELTREEAETLIEAMAAAVNSVPSYVETQAAHIWCETQETFAASVGVQS